MSSIGAALVLTVTAGVHGFSVDITPTESMDDCHSLRTAVALTYARNEEYTKTSYPDLWQSRQGERLANNITGVKLECTPVK